MATPSPSAPATVNVSGRSGSPLVVIARSPLTSAKMLMAQAASVISAALGAGMSPGNLGIRRLAAHSAAPAAKAVSR
jgi:hypothetical protein